MLGKTKWLIEHRLILCSCEGVVILEHVKQTCRQLVLLLTEGHKASGQKPHLIADASQLTKQPNPLHAYSYLSYRYDSCWGEIMVGGIGNNFLYVFTKVLAEMVTTKFSVYESPRQALTALQSKDLTLPNLAGIYRDANYSHQGR